MRNDIIQNDCFMTMGDNIYDAVITDPPYGVMVNKDYDHLEGRNDIVRDVMFDRFTPVEYKQFIIEFCGLVGRLAKKDASLVAFFDYKQIGALIEHLIANGWTYRAVLFWRKTNPFPAINLHAMRNCIETAVFVTRGDKKVQSVSQSDLLNCFNCPVMTQKDGFGHPTRKPTKVMEWVLRLSTAPGDLILDPFAGSGTTNIACLNLGRGCVGIEKNEEYAQNAAKRIVEYRLRGKYQGDKMW